MSQAKRDQNSVPTLIAVSNVDGITPTLIYADPVTHRLLVDSPGSTGSFTDNEVVAGAGTAWTLGAIPTLGSQHIYANGQRLTPGVGNDYTIAGAAITTANSYAAGQLLADYRF